MSYRYGTRKGLSTKFLCVFDLEVPPDVVPYNGDGEVTQRSNSSAAERKRETFMSNQTAFWVNRFARGVGGSFWEVSRFSSAVEGDSKPREAVPSKTDSCCSFDGKAIVRRPPPFY